MRADTEEAAGLAYEASTHPAAAPWCSVSLPPASCGCDGPPPSRPGKGRRTEPG